MLNVLNIQKLVPLNQDQRFAMFVERNLTIKKVFEAKLGQIRGRQKDYKKYCCLMFALDAIQALDRSSQVIYYHQMKRVDIKATCTITSLSEESIDRICVQKTNEWLEMVETFDYASINGRMAETQSFVRDVLYNKLSDVELINKYQIDIGVTKILRRLTEAIFRN